MDVRFFPRQEGISFLLSSSSEGAGTGKVTCGEERARIAGCLSYKIVGSRLL